MQEFWQNIFNFFAPAILMYCNTGTNELLRNAAFVMRIVLLGVCAVVR